MYETEYLRMEVFGFFWGESTIRYARLPAFEQTGLYNEVHVHTYFFLIIHY